VTTPAPARGPAAWIGWAANRPYLLLTLTSLFWAGNIVLSRYIAGHVPPIGLAFVRWSGTCLLMLPFAWPHLARDWPVLRGQLPLMILLATTGIAANTVFAYYGLQFTEALNALLVQSAGPLFIALWAMVLFRIRLRPAQALGIAASLSGVLVIVLRGDFGTLAGVRFNKGDLLIVMALLTFGFYSALVTQRPKVHQLSFLAFVTGCGAALLLPFLIWERATGFVFAVDWLTAASLAYSVLFPSALAYLFYNRGVELVGPNRAAPFFHLIPVFGSAMAIVFLGEQPRLFHLFGYVLVLAGVAIAARR
jgi:drug/metabolite transporter (DMT)-like permease